VQDVAQRETCLDAESIDRVDDCDLRAAIVTVAILNQGDGENTGKARNYGTNGEDGVGLRPRGDQGD